MTTSLADVRARLPELTQRDQYRLSRRADRAAALRDARARERAFGQILAELDRAEALVAARRQSVPVISYPPELPITQKKDEIAAAIRDHQVVVVAGETGSGKTTQLPKICLELGRGVTGQIGHTQPRRIAARTVAARIAEELGTELGATVGYQVRFNDNSSDETLVKLMTDGILLAEMQRDRRLLRYDTLIIDEAHERSLNIDFLLGYLKRLLPGRPDLKVIITSATIDPQRFARHFGGAPVIEVSGRTYPVEVRYRPIGRPGPLRRGTARSGPGHLCRRGRAERRRARRHPGLPQRRAGDPRHRRRAERPRGPRPAGRPGGAAAVRPAVDGRAVPGVPAAPRAPRGARHQRRGDLADRPRHPVRGRPGHGADLPVQLPDQGAAAADRADLAGVSQPAEGPVRAASSDGICIRLYSEEDFAARPEFTDPEILRTNLASVILRMAALDLGEMADFPFVDPPEERNVATVSGCWRSSAPSPRRPSGRDTLPGGRRGRGRLLSDVGRETGRAAGRPAHRADDHRGGA